MGEHAEPGGPPADAGERGPAASVAATVERMLTAGLGALGTTAERAESLLGGAGSGQKLGDRAAGALAGLIDDMGLVKRERVEELELKLAQLEHRVRLLEQAQHSAPPELV